MYSQINPCMLTRLCASTPPRPGVSACNGKHYLPPSCVNYVGQDGNALLPPFEQTRPVNAREKREKSNQQQQKAILVFETHLTEAQ